MKKIIAIFSLSLIAIFADFAAGAQAAANQKNKLEITSPDGKLKAFFFADGSGRLSYELVKNGQLVVESSPLGIMVDGKDLGAGVDLPASINASEINESYPIMGNHAIAADHCNTAVINLAEKSGGAHWQLEVRAYNDGLALRYIVPGNGAMVVSGEATAFKIPSGSVAFFQTNTANYEGVWHGEKAELINGILGMPLTVKLSGQAGYLAITEAADYNYSGMTLKAEGDGVFRAIFEDDKTWTVQTSENSPLRSPWRVIIAVDNLSQLVNSDIIPDLNPAPSKELFADSNSWIKPGRALWSWWSQDTGDFDRQKKYIDAAGKLGFEYILVDAGWEHWSQGSKGKWELIKDLVDYGKTRHVEIWVWKHYREIRDKNVRKEFFAKLKDAGVAGIKIDFMDSESQEVINFYESALQDAARVKLMVNFHGANKPAGEYRTYLNEMTREGVRGFEYNRAAIFKLPVTHDVIIPFTRMVAGPMDFTPVSFNPSKTGKASFAHELAKPIVYLSMLTHYADRWENFLENPKSAPALDVLKAIPTVWDETIVLDGSELGECAAFARRSGDQWFIGVLNADKAKDFTINLNFLGKGKYKAIILADNPRTKAAFVRSGKMVNAGDKLGARMRIGGGLVVMLTPEQQP